MAEIQSLMPMSINDDKSLTKAENAEIITKDNNPDDDDDLEDGEIDDEEDEDVVLVSTTTLPTNINTNTNRPNTINNRNISKDSVVTIDLVNDKSPPSAAPQPKPKKPKPVEDDFASSIEKALASALKKKGVEPVVPKVIGTRDDQLMQDSEEAPTQSRSSRRRKRKKHREEKEKESHHEKKKQRHESPDSQKPRVPNLDDEVEVMGDDDFEMLNVRGGSPPPMGLGSRSQQLPLSLMGPYKDQYDSDGDSSYSQNSYDSQDMDNDKKRHRRNRKDSHKKRGGRGNRDDDRHGKRSRNRNNDSPERQEPRKMELCKFYLMECCAKKDKCSYMHSDFPCKYYYLGMPCEQKEECKFAHGEPMTDQLRNILLKHMETAPKEILGNFKRISRENALAQLTKRHEELCKQYKVKIPWSAAPIIPPSHHNRRANNDSVQQQQQQHHQVHQPAPRPSPHPHIPSLLDLVLKPPDMTDDDMPESPNETSNSEKHRKSRWDDSSKKANNRVVLEKPSPPRVGPVYLDLKNLHGILSEEHIEKLSKNGIVNLEEVNQLTVGQLNQIGLTVAEISEIQLKAKNMSELAAEKKLDLPFATIKEEPSTTAIPNKLLQSEPMNGKTELMDTASSNQRLEAAPTKPESESSNSQTFGSQPPALLKPNEPQNPEAEATTNTLNSDSNSSNVVTVDYSQYLKDSHLAYDRNDSFYDDEKDDEQLIIDDGGNAESENHSTSNKNESTERKRSESIYDKHSSLLSKFNIPTDFSLLKNPFKMLSGALGGDEEKKKNISAIKGLPDVRGGATPADPFQKGPSDDDSEDACYYASRGRRSRSATPPCTGSSGSDGSHSPRSFGADNEKKTSEFPAKYERSTIYDFREDRVEEDSIKPDKDMRYIEGLQLPFQPVVNYTPATEIDGSITSHLPISYKVYEVLVPTPSYAELRRSGKHLLTDDPRIRRILGRSETMKSQSSPSASRPVRKLSNTIASPESEGSPKYIVQQSSPSTMSAEDRKPQKPSTLAMPSQPRGDPRRGDPRQAAKQASPISTSNASTSSTTSSSMAPISTASAAKQNIEIRNYLQKSEWYKNLNSKFKIMVNQQLALVSTELKKFHQDPSPNKIFDMNFIVNNSTLQQILTNLGIFIDDNGEVGHIEADTDEETGNNASKSASNSDSNSNINGAGGSGGVNNIILPNLSEPPPNPQMDFLRNPPPNILAQSLTLAANNALNPVFRQATATINPNSAININIPNLLQQSPNATRPSLLGPGPTALAPRNPLNPFADIVSGMGPAAAFLPGVVPGLLGHGPLGANGPLLGAPFGNFRATPPNMQQQRNFNNQRNNQQRNNKNRRNNNNNSNNKNSNTNNNNSNNANNATGGNEGANKANNNSQ